METLPGRITLKNTLVSVMAGIGIFIVTWFYLNSYYTLGIEDDLLSRETLFIHNFVKPKPKKNKQLVFINTGKDLNLIEDTAGYGNIAVSDRYKLYKLLHAINTAHAKPQFILLDLQFYYPYSYSVDDSIQNTIKKINAEYRFPDKSVDDSLAAEIKKNDKIGISALLENNKIKIPMYKGTYGLAGYTTFGSFLNRFRIFYNDLHAISIPGLIHQKVDSAVYSGGRFATLCNNRLCFNYMWPDYYYDEKDIKADTTYQEYHIGSLLPLLNNPQAVQTMFKDKIIFIGNFEDDIHTTPAGKIPGTIILADVYLSLLNGRHYVPYLWVLFVIIVFSVMSHVAIYNQLRYVKIDLRFALLKKTASFLKDYVSYVLVLTLLSLLSLLIFNLTISLFLPATIFSAIEFVKKKYLNIKAKHEKN